MDYNWDFASVFVYWNVLAMGLWATFKLFIICSTLGLGGGLFMGMLRYSKTRWISYPAMLYVEIFRNTPVLVQIIWFFFALPVVTGIEVSPMMAAKNRLQRPQHASKHIFAHHIARAKRTPPTQ